MRRYSDGNRLYDKPHGNGSKCRQLYAHGQRQVWNIRGFVRFSYDHIGGHTLNRAFTVSVLAALGLAACSSHANTIPNTPVQHRGVLSIELKIPNATQTSGVARRPQYISPATKSVLIIPTGGPQFFANVTPTSPGCTATASGTVCRLDNIGASVGQSELTVYAYDAPVPPAGSKVGNVLSAGSTTVTIVAGQSNVVQLTLGGVPAKAQILSLNTTPVNGAATDLHFSVKVMDADGYTIVGSTPYGSSDAQPPAGVSVSIAQTTPDGFAPPFQFVVNGTKSTGSMVLTSPTDTYSVIYPGSGLISATLQVGGGPPLASAIITPQAAAAPFQNVPQLEPGAVLLPWDATFWFTEPSKKAIGYVSNGVERDIVLPSGHTPTQLAGGAKFMYGQTFVFGTQEGTVGYLTADGVRGEYTLPTNSPVGGVTAQTDPSEPYGIEYTQPAAHKVGVAPLFGGNITEYTLPQAATPGKMDSGYFVDPGSNSVGYVNSTGWKEFPLPTAGSDPTDVAFDTGYAIWISEGGANRLAHMDTQSGVAAEFPTDAPLTSIATADQFQVIAATDNAGNIEYFQQDGSRALFKTVGAGPATQIRGYSQDQLIYVCASCAVNIQQFLF